MRKSFAVGAMTVLIGGISLGQVNARLLTPTPLNHFYVVLDSATYKAIEQSSFLRQDFAVTEQRTTTRTDITYTGVYFYGANTYFEFFDASATAIGKLSDSGVAFGFDKAGAMEASKAALAPRFSILEAPITRHFKEKQVPWFYMAVPSNFSPSSGLRFWIMEYHPRFLAEWNPQAGNRNEGVSRKQILERYADVLKDTPRKPYLKDVVALTIAVDEPTQKDFVDLCKLLGYRVRPAGTSTLLEGPDIKLRLIPHTATARGIQEITMKVDRKPVEQTTFSLGERSVLRFHGNGLATWSF